MNKYEGLGFKNDNLKNPFCYLSNGFCLTLSEELPEIMLHFGGNFVEIWVILWLKNLGFWVWLLLRQSWVSYLRNCKASRDW